MSRKIFTQCIFLGLLQPLASQQKPCRTVLEEGIQFCSTYKHNLVKYLEAYYDTFRTWEICSNVLEDSRSTKLRKGYRMVQPQKKTNKNPKNPLQDLVAMEALKTI